MKDCQIYLEKQKRKTSLPLQPYAPITVVIPCYDEPELSKTLDSLADCKDYNEALHIIVIINHSEDSPPNVKEQNKTTATFLQQWKQNNETPLRSLSFIEIIFDKNTGGVGDARKIGMDEAVAQYVKHSKDGIIVSLDADTICASNYLYEIFKHFDDKPHTNTLVIPYAHRLQDCNFEVKNAIIQYELYLRYMSMAYSYVGHTNTLHTIGSAFAVKASAYCKQGGMNRRQAGEDFYFLQKMFDFGNCYELTTSCVYPSPRISNRVPFGTGKAVENLIQSGEELQTYSFQAFKELKTFFDIHTNLYKIEKKDYEQIVYNKLGGLIKSFLIASDFYENLDKINKNCASEAMFSKKFFQSFSIFQIIKYLNFTHTYFLQKTGIFHAISCLPESSKFDFATPERLLTSIRNVRLSAAHSSDSQ